MESEISRDITEEIGSDTRVVQFPHAIHNSMSIAGSACALSRSDLQTLDDAFSRVTQGRGMMVHKFAEQTESGTETRHVLIPEVQGHTTCP